MDVSRLALPLMALALGTGLWPDAAAAQPQAPPATAAPVSQPPAPAQVPEAAPAPAPEAASGRVPAQALEHYHRARAHYEAGRYHAAAAELEAAYALDPSGVNLLYNLGMVYERMGELDSALRAYRRYHARTGDPTERARTTRILARLRGARTEVEARERRHGRADALFWLTTGASLASVSLGVTWFATQEEGRQVELPAVAFTVGGVSLGVLAAVLYFARWSEPPVTVTATVAGERAGVGLAGRF